MKTRLFLFCLLSGLSAVALAQTETIGINTDTPPGVLHINTPQAADQVLIDAQGEIGIGRLDPAAKIDIVSSTPGALRIQDGTEGEGKVLLSGADGLASWTPLASASWFASLYNPEGSPLLPTVALPYASIRWFTGYADWTISDAGLGSVNRVAGTITLPPFGGKYRLSITVYWIQDLDPLTPPNPAATPDPYTTKAVLRIRHANNSVEERTFSFWGGREGYGVQPTFITLQNLSAGDVLSLGTDETTADSANSARAVLFMVELLL
jgi:hypothetical protein